MNARINNYNTIGSLIKYTRQLDMSYDRLFFKSRINSADNQLIVNSTSLVNKYFDFINDSVYTIQLTNSEYMRYRYQPKLFCYEVYGTTELWSALLKINNFISVTDFNNKRIKVFSERIFNILNEILVYEKTAILENRESVDY